MTFIAKGAKGSVQPCPQTASVIRKQAWRREEARFRRDYNDKLFNGLVVFALADILLFRFVIRISLAETVGWVGFVFLQVPRRLCMRMIMIPSSLGCQL
jgi:hypothetical protein